MNALIFAALPIVALLVVAALGLLWLRQPVDSSVSLKPRSAAVHRPKQHTTSSKAG